MSQPPTPVSPGKHMPVLDGIRGLAVALVMFQHFFHGIDKADSVADDVMFGLAWRSWMGVDLFFVLSGFLITGILWDSKAQKGYFKNFYARRVLRIFPAYYVVLLVFFVLMPRLTDAPQEFGGPSGAAVADQLWHWTYLSNFRIAANGWWYTTNVPNVFWSLAIEEQFYLVWPLVVLLCGRRALMVLCGVLLAVSFTVRMALSLQPDVSWVVSYVVTPARMDALVVGASLAVLLRSGIDIGRSRLAAWVVGGAMLVPLGLLMADHPEGFREIPVQETRFTVVALLFGALVWLGVTGGGRRGILECVFCAGFMRMLGKYSYALYLWHGPVVETLRHYYQPNDHLLFGSKVPHTILFSLLAGAASLLVAWLSWNLVEKHCLRLKDRFAAKPGSAGAASAPAGAGAASAPAGAGAAGAPAGEADAAAPRGAAGDRQPERRTGA